MSITAANAVVTLSVAGVFSSPVQLKGFSADDIFDVDQIKAVETSMGVDGILSGGFVFNEVVQNIMLQSDSPSCFLFDQWAQAQLAQKDVFTANGNTLLLGIKTSFAQTKGFLTDYPPIPSVGKTIKPRKYTIRWERVAPAPTV